MSKECMGLVRRYMVTMFKRARMTPPPWEDIGPYARGLWVREYKALKEQQKRKPKET